MQLCLCFTLFLNGVFSLNLASFSPKPFGHVLSIIKENQVLLTQVSKGSSEAKNEQRIVTSKFVLRHCSLLECYFYGGQNKGYGGFSDHKGLMYK